MDCSIMFLRVNTCSIVPLPSRNPAYSHLKFASMPSIPWFNDSTKNLTWSWEYGDYPEIVAFSQITLLQYFNNHSLLAIMWHLHILMCMLKQRTQVSCSGSTLNISASIPSTPGALQQVFKWVIAAWTHSTVKGRASIQPILNLS